MLSRKLLRNTTPVKSISYVTTVQDSTTTTTHTFTATSIGTASSSRKIVLVIGQVASTTGQTVNAATIGGVSATEAVESSGGLGLAIYHLDVSSGTTADIVVTTSNNVCVAVSVFALYNLNSTSVVTTATGTTTGTSLTSSTFNASNGDIVVYGASGQDANAITTTYSGTGTLTESFDAVFTNNANRRTSAGYVEVTAAGTGVSLTTSDTASIVRRIAAVSWN